ncbi:unnamed protein product [Phytophthora lilii]|uniref:Unnamed protein product n=1 Tax=Phytophthora lilii TaxID=2077276 RepID=A0A9W7CQT1_9STRA|nr:unnamed protein product [Phytophthora lilii]
MTEVRLRACLPHHLTREQFGRVIVLEASGVYNQTKLVRNAQPIKTLGQPPTRQVGILPAPSSINQSSICKEMASRQLINCTVSSPFPETANIAKTVVLQGLQLLFHCEYILLVEYVECIIPLVFVAYKSVLEKLPNVKFYPGGAGNWGINVVTNVVILAALEMVSLLFFSKFLQRKFRFSALLQLAFVLET